MAINALFREDLKVISLGNKDFAEDLLGIGVKTALLNWKPPAGGSTELMAAIDRLKDNPLIERANELALERLNSSRPVLVDIRPACEVIPGMGKRMLLHAGPPITWDRMCGPMRGAIIGACIFEGWATDEEEGEKLAQSGAIAFSPCHEHSAVGPMAGIISPSMPVFVLENKSYGNYTYATLNEGLGKVLRYGAFSNEVIDRLIWMRDILSPGLRKAILLSGGIDIKSIIAQALHMGDEVHNRNKAATSLFVRTVMPSLIESDLTREELISIVSFINSNDHFFLNLSMACCKAALDAADNIDSSSMVTVMSRNGTDFGIKVSGMSGKWFTGPAQMVKGLLFPGYTEEDASLDIGDSAITETAGLGGFAMAAAMAIVQFVGGSPEDAIGFSKAMYEITLGESTSYSIPVLDFRGTATGIDIRLVGEKNILPQINTGIAHRLPGIGQVGAGLVNPPFECFSKAILEFDKKINNVEVRK